jgi:RND family efflux transporter MFP subunit
MRTSTLTTFGTTAIAAAGFAYARQNLDAQIATPTVLAATVAAPAELVAETKTQIAEPVAVSTFAGIAIAAQTTQVGFPAEAVLEYVIDAGQPVVKGQIIAKLNTTELEAKLVSARHTARDESAVNAAQARLDQADNELTRIMQAAKSGAAENHEVIKSQSAVAVAKAELAQTVEQRTLAGLRVAEIDAQIATRQIKAPHAGIVSNVWHGQGEVARLGTPILKLVQTADLLVKVECPAETAGQFAAGSSAQVSFPGQGKPVVATVERQAVQINAITGTSWITLRCSNANGTLPAGSTVSVSFDADAT